MPERTVRQQSRLDPAPAWTVLTEAPLKGLSLAREAGRILAWDEGEQLYLLDQRGEHQSVAQAPGKVLAGAISDDGALIALLGEGSRLWLLGADFEIVADRQAPPESWSLTVDPHGRYVAVASKLSLTQFYNRFGRPAGRFETIQALAHLAFVPARPFLLGAAAFGMLIGVVLKATSGGRLETSIPWEEKLSSNIGQLATSGDGGLVLVSCFTHGVQRFDMRGHNDGAYHLGGTASHAVPDFAGRLIAVATRESELAVLSPAGNVRWRTGLPRPAIALATDALGRYIIYGQATGEVVRLDLYGGSDRPTAQAPTRVASGRRAGAGSIRPPAWAVPVASTDEQAESAVLAVLDDPPRIGLLTNTNRLQVFTTEGKNLGQAPDVLGVGRFLRTAPGWIAAATDRSVVCYDARRNTTQRVDLSLVEITHLAIRPDSFGLAIVQERDRVGRATLAGRWVWKSELKSAVEDLAIGPEGFAALTTADGIFSIFDPAGARAGEFESDPSEPLCLIEAPDAAPGGTTWLTLARRAQILRGHGRNGRVLWESPVPWEGWQLHRLGPMALITAPDGRALAYDAAGHLRAQGRTSDGSGDVFGVTARDETFRVTRQGVHLICAEVSGRVRWRAVADEPLGPLAAGQSGVAVLIGRSLAWFPEAAGG
jgi:hypothetical protein